MTGCLKHALSKDAVLVHENLDAIHGAVLALHCLSYPFVNLRTPLLHPELDVLKG